MKLKAIIILSCIAFVLATDAFASPEGFVPITPENAAEVRPLASFASSAWQIRFSEDSSLLIAPAAQASIVWDLTNSTALPIPLGQILAISPDSSTLLISDSVARTTSLINVKTGQSHTLFNEVSNSANFSPDGTQVLTIISADNLVQAWDVATGQEIAPLNHAHGYGFSFPQFSTSRYIMAVGNDNAIHLYDAATGEEHVRLETHAFRGVFTPDGTRLITYDLSNFTIWDAASGEQLAQGQTFSSTSGGNNALVSPDGNLVLFYDLHASATAYLWNLEDPTDISLQAQFNYTQRTNFMFSPDSQTIALYGGLDSVVQLMDVTTGQERAALPVNAGVFTFSADGRMLISAAADSLIRLWLWDGITASELATLPGNSFVLSPDGATLATLFGGKVVLIYGVPTDARSVQPVLIPAEILPSSVNVRAAPSLDAETIGQASGIVLVGARNTMGDYVYLPDYAGWVRADSSYLALQADFPIELLTVMDTQQAIAMLSTPTPPPPTPTATPTLLPSPTWTPGSPSLPTVSALPAELPALPPGFERITLENLDEVRLLGVLPAGMPLNLYNAQTVVSADGLTFISSPARYSITPPRVFDLIALDDIGHFETMPRQDIMAVSQRADLVASSAFGYDAQIFLWNVETGVQLRTLSGLDTGIIENLAFSPDGTLLASSGHRVNTRLWNPATGESVLTLPTGGQFVFSPDGRLVATIPGQSVVRLYDTATGELRATLNTGRYTVKIVRFSPDGSILLTNSAKSVQLWDVESGQPATLIQLSEILCCDGDAVLFSPDGQLLATLDYGNILRLWDTVTGTMLATLPVNSAGGMAFSPDGTMLVTGDPLQVIDMATWTSYPLEGGYIGRNSMFSPDGSTLLIGDFITTMVFGIPNDIRPAWQPVTGHIVPSGVNVRTRPEQEAEHLGYATGEVLIGGRDLQSSGVYLPELRGWVWSDPDFLNLGDLTLADLPILAYSTE